MPLVVDTATNSGTIDAVNSFNWSHTVANQLNRVLVTTIATYKVTSSATISCTYNGVSMTQVATKSVGTYYEAAIFILVNPAVGAHNVVMTLSTGNTGKCEAGAVSFYDASDAQPFTTSSTNVSGANPTVSINSLYKGSCMVDCVMDTDGSTATVGSGQTSIYTYNDSQPDNHLSSYKVLTTSGTNSMYWTKTGSATAYCVVVISSRRGGGAFLLNFI